MGPALLRALAGASDCDLADAATAALEGDEVALYGVDDRLAELGEEPMRTLKIGEPYFVQTVTYAFIGRLTEKSWDELVLSGDEPREGQHEQDRPKNCIVYDTGDFTDCLAKGTLAVCAVMPGPTHIGTATITAVTRWRHKLPTQSSPRPTEQD